MNEIWWYTVFREKIKNADDDELPELYEKLYRDFLCKEKGHAKHEKAVPVTKNDSIHIGNISNSYHFVRFLMYPLLGKTTVLELGCGASNFPFVLATDGCKVYAVDMRQCVIDNQRKFISLLPEKLQKNIRFDCALAEKLPYSDNFFDVVLGVDFLEHVRDLDRLMKECVRVLKPNGKMCFSTPIRGLGWSPEHLHNFNEENLEALFNKHGFKVKFYKERFSWSHLNPDTFIMEVF